MKSSLFAAALALLSHASLSHATPTYHDALAQYAVDEYQDAQIHTLANMVSFATVNTSAYKTPDNPEFIGFKHLLKMKAAQLGLDYQDLGYTVLIGMGEQQDKVTIVTHGDVQPADATKWAKSPFVLDSTTEPGKLIARGTEDDKGAIATALYAMKAIKDQGIQLDNRIELMIYLAEESDWQPLRTFMQSYQQPKYAVTIDASYPVVVAEKGWSLVAPTFSGTYQGSQMYVSELTGGAFVSQIPEDASVRVHNASAEAIATLRANAAELSDVEVQIEELADNEVLVRVKGTSAHSSEPESGVNAIAHLGAVFNDLELATNADGQALLFINELIGLDLYGKQFGDIAYSHDFMGPMTVAPTLIERQNDTLTLSVNLRRPEGKPESQLRTEINNALNRWQRRHQVELAAVDIEIGTPMLLDDAPHADALLSIFKHYTGDEQAEFVSIGGGTNAKLFNNAVSFGPSMPGKAYTGHSEHEFMTPEQLRLNLKMYTAMMVTLGNM